MLNSPWHERCERSDGCAWALVLGGETATKTCCRGACTHDCDPQAADSDVSSHTLYPEKVRPMPCMWVQSVPVTAIPWGSMNTEQHYAVIRSIRKDD
jgi:hypothetical protein